MQVRTSVTLSADEQRQLPGKRNRLPGYPHRFHGDLRATAELVTRGRVEGPDGLPW